MKLDDVTDPKMSGFINETIARIMSISKIHDQLLKIEEVYELDIKTYLEELVVNIINTYCEDPSLYPLHISIEKARFHIDDVLLIGLLVNESVSNIIKYAYKREVGGEIIIELEISSENEVKLLIADKGAGLPFDSLDGASQSNGIQLISVFAEQLKGTLSLTQTQGTEYQIHFVKTR
jgi:two-component sensor histidine kinase